MLSPPSCLIYTRSDSSPKLGAKPSGNILVPRQLPSVRVLRSQDSLRIAPRSIFPHFWIKIVALFVTPKCPLGNGSVLFNGITDNNPKETIGIMRSLQTKPYMLDNEQGQLLQSLGASVSIKATSEQTGGVFNLFEVCCPPDYATPLLIHYTEDVAVYVLDGRLTFFWGSEKREAIVGSFFYQPRGTPHGFHVQGTTPARILYMTMPAGF